MTPREDNRSSRRTRTAGRARILAAAAAFLMTLATAVPLVALTEEIRISLPVRARLDLAGKSSIAVAPCVVVSRERDGRFAGSAADIGEEFERYLEKLVRRDTDLKMIETGPVDYPVHDLESLGQDQDFWRALAERSQADLVLTCSIDYEVLDQSGYRNEQYTSPFDGQIYQRQTLIETTGFEYDIVLQVYDGPSGELLLADNFRDFQESAPDSADPLPSMFENLYAVEDRIAGIFSQGKVEVTRLLFVD